MVHLIKCLRFTALFAVVAFAAGCTFKKNVPDHPYPSKARVSKSFFQKSGKDGNVRLKTFIAGWSPEMTAGEYSEGVMVHYNHADHVNVVFEIEETKLVGRKIIPSFIDGSVDCLLRDDPRAKACRQRWPSIVTFDIESQYYYEPTKDSRGRTTDVYTENSQRSHWSARPFMNINLRSVRIKDWAMAIMWNGYQVEAVPDSEVEWGENPGYLGFTVDASDAYLEGKMQGRFRFNFLEFEHKPDFQITPYRTANARYINILHVIGKQIDGDPQNNLLYAAHWDTKQKHTIYLHGFPKEYEQIGKDVIEHWNDAFQKVGHGRPLEVKISDRRYAFDLRYPSIIWVSDRRLSYSAPLGVGMALSDVRNGEIKWGAVTVWGGMLEDMINRHSPNATASGAMAAAISKPIIQLGLMQPKNLVPNTRLAVPAELMTGSFEGFRAQLTGQMEQHAQNLQYLLKNSDQSTLVKMATDANPSLSNPLAGEVESMAHPEEVEASQIPEMLKAKSEAASAVLSAKTFEGTSVINEMADRYARLTQTMAAMAQHVGSLDKVYTSEMVQQMIGMPTLKESQSYLPTYDRHGLQTRLAQNSELSRKEMIETIENGGRLAPTGNAAFCLDRRMYDQADGYAAGLASGNIDKVQAVRSLIKDLLLHEVGHMLGLGHNFKENILPARGSVPNTSEKVGLYKPFSIEEMEKQAKNGFKNYSTVMGYKDGITDITMEYDELMPGPGDVLSLQYLYNRAYPVLPLKSKGESDYTFVKLTTDGWILPQVKANGVTYRPAYFPACNDYTATLTMDPYCARWDRGYNASTIVDNHFQNFRGNLMSQLTAFTDTVKGSDYRAYEYYLWNRSLTTFSRTRVFYDYMRQKYAEDFANMVRGGSESSKRNLLEFADTCRAMREGKPTTNDYLRKLFTRKPELLDLCVAGSQFVSEIAQLLQLNGKDWTELDYFNAYSSVGMTGGEAKADLGRAYGVWRELSRSPIKISAIMALTSPNPYVYMSGWVIPISRYSGPDAAYHISTLYAKDYTQAVAQATEMNLNLGNPDLDQKTSIGRTILAMGHYLSNSWFSNDALTFGTPFIENIRNQTKFRYSYALIEIEKEQEEGSSQIARKFKAKIYNTYGSGAETLQEIYVYPGDRLVIRPPQGSMLKPVTTVRWYSGTSGYFYAIKLDYPDEFFDFLKTNSVRRTLNETYQEVVKNCIQGPGDTKNGLRSFFNKDTGLEKFEGFKFLNTIGRHQTSTDEFLRSVELLFDRYYANYYMLNGKKTKLFTTAPERSTCEDAINGQSLIVMAASILNGYYFFEIQDFLEKDMRW